ncbi:hypothetical protein [Lysinibacillus sp. JNUCC-52]|uniref:hypothetical protein n=1 Tax=Lysinibacillus sp. JNUCC-52 TaxID=2792480 RepID=UPI001937D7DB|nr:hypothetical protein JNUCC52_20070 [Lysinibacillus sp. JNUCC-52]
MVKYYYDKFTTINTTIYNNDAPWDFESNDGLMQYSTNFKNFTHDSLTNVYELAGERIGAKQIAVGDLSYYTYNGALYRYTAKKGGYSEDRLECTVHKKVPSKNTTSTAYSKGALIQSNIPAEEGTYPANGRHTDGYWYVKGAKVNTAPTQPGAFSYPIGTLEVGDSKVFTVGASTDAESNLLKYIWEVSINDAAYSKAGETTTPSFTYTIPTATSLKMRLKAVDSAGLESAYRESSLYTVSKPKYYFTKYNTITNSLYTPVVSSLINKTTLSNGYGIANVFNVLLGANYGITDGQIFYEVQALSNGSLQLLNSANGSMTHLLYYFDIKKFDFYCTYNGSVYKVNMETPEGREGYYNVNLYRVTSQLYSTNYSKGSLVQSGIAVDEGTYPINGRHTDGFWYERGSRVNQSITPPAPFTSPIQGKKFKPNEVANITFGASHAPNLSLYEVDYRYNSIGTWTQLAYNNTLTRSFTTTTDKALKTLELRVRAKNTSNVYSDYVYSEPFEIEHNVAPTITLTGPGDNTTLYENDTLNIAGTAFDADADQSVTVYYQINSEARKILATNLSQIQISLSKQITFKGGKIYDGETALTGTLADGVAHTLKVWAEDSEKALSAIVERTFYVVPNRAPLLSVDAVVPSGVVDADKFKISGTATDQDANSTLKVTSRINAGNAVEIYSGSDRAWEFDLALSQLVVGQNTIVIEVIDNYGAKTSKTVTLNKKELKTPILQSVARYKIEPPKGSAKGVLLFIQRDEALDIKVELSMTASDEQEQYETLTPVNTAPVQQGLVEDTFEYEGLEAKQNIILKITSSRTDLALNHKIHLISGAVD